MIAKLLAFIFVLFFSITGLFAMITISTNTQPIKYSIFNELDSNTNPRYIDDHMIHSKELNNNYDTFTARSCIDLISRIELNEIVIPHLYRRTEFRSKMNRDKVFSVVWYSNDVIWVVFRGTWNLYEWINNFKIQQTSYEVGKNSFDNLPLFMEQNRDIMIHTGFINMYNELRKGLLESVKEHKGTKICVTGYSVGASIGNLLALDLKTLGYDVQLYTFGSPRVGNREFSDTVEKSGLKHYRIVNTEDTITQMPLPVSPNFSKHDEPFFYMHNGEEYKFTKHNKSIFTNHSPRTYVNNIVSN